MKQRIRIIATVVIVCVIVTLLAGGCDPQPTQSPESVEEMNNLALELLGVLAAAFSDYRLKAILLLIFVDLGLGVFAAMRSNQFEFGKVADFYKTNVVPYVGGYTIIYVAVQIAATGLEDGVLEPYSHLFSEVFLNAAWGILLLKLGDSALENAKKLGYGVDNTPELQ